MRDDPQVLSKRLAAFVNPIPAKDLARRIGCDVRTAENIRRGHWPVARHWIGLLIAFGRDLTEAVFHPEDVIARLESEVLELERQLAEAKAERLKLVGTEVQSSEPRRPRVAARHHENRTAAMSGQDPP